MNFFISDNDVLIFLYLIFMFIFIYGVISFSLVTQNNILKLLFLFELIILIISGMFLIVGDHYLDIYGQIVVLYLLTIAAVEASIGLAIIYVYYRLWSTIKLDKISKIKG
jgi:NADH-quinone oxidoreductase subunit K